MGLTRLFGGASGVTNQPAGLDFGFGGSSIKSIQRGSIAMTISNTVANATISSIDPSKSVVLFGSICAVLGAFIGHTDIRMGGLTSTNVNFTRGYQDGTAGTTINYVVIEFNNVKSIQTGETIADTATTRSVTISPVNLSKSFELISASNGSGGTNLIQAYLSCKLVNTTTLELYQGNNISRLQRYTVIEFN